MSLVIYTLIWVAVSLTMCLFSFFLGRLPVIDLSPLPWVVHRSYVPGPARGKAREYATNAPETKARRGRVAGIRAAVTGLVLSFFLIVAGLTRSAAAELTERARAPIPAYVQPAPPPPCGHAQCADPRMRIYCPQRRTQSPPTQTHHGTGRRDGVPAPGGRPGRRSDRPTGPPTAPQQRSALQRNRHHRHPRTAHPAAPLAAVKDHPSGSHLMA